MTVRAAIAGIAAVLIAGTGLAPAAAAPTLTASAGELELELVWQHTFSGQKFVYGGPGVAVLDGGGPAVIMGSDGKKVYALHLSDGSEVDGSWPYTASAAVRSTPSVSGTGATARIYVGVGSEKARAKGGYLALKPNGTRAWYRTVHLLPGSKGELRGVQSSLAVGYLSSGTDVIGAAMGQMQLAMKGSNGQTLSGFPWLMADTNISTPALAPLFPNTTAKDYIIEGGDSTAGVAFYKTYKNGGHIRILKPSGSAGKPYPNDGLVCEYKTNQVVPSSPAVGPFLADDKIGIVVGTGFYYKNASDSKKIIAINTACKRQWSRTLDGDTRSSPALADLTGDGDLEVVANSSGGTVYALDGETGNVIWNSHPGGNVWGGPVTFRAPGDTFQYVLVGSSNGLQILDGRDGSYVGSWGGFTMHTIPTVTADPDGSIGITITGVVGGDDGIVQHYRVVGSSGVTSVQTDGAWPMFHHDPQLSGYTDHKYLQPRSSTPGEERPPVTPRTPQEDSPGSPPGFRG